MFTGAWPNGGYGLRHGTGCCKANIFCSESEDAKQPPPTGCPQGQTAAAGQTIKNGSFFAKKVSLTACQLLGITKKLPIREQI
jgi:hypothetical protein